MDSNPTWQPLPPQHSDPYPSQQQAYYYYANPSTDAAEMAMTNVPNPYSNRSITAYGGFPVASAAAETELPAATGQYRYGVDANVNQFYYGSVDPTAYATASVPQIPPTVLNPTSRPHNLHQRLNAKGKRKVCMKTPKAVQPLHCGVCKIDCDTQEVLNIHKQGKQHKKNLKKLQDAITPKPQKAPSTSDGPENNEPPKINNEPPKNLEGGSKPQAIHCGVCNINCDTQETFKRHEAGKKHLKNVKRLQQAPVTANGEEIKEAKLSAMPHPVTCPICNIVCNAQEVLNVHNVGKKHMKNLKLQGLVAAPNPGESQLMVADHGNSSEQKKRKEAVEDDVESKKRKVLEGGGVTRTESKIRCDICNVEVNSQIVYNSHIAGSKHAANVKKLQEAALVVEVKQEAALVVEDKQEAALVVEDKQEEALVVAGQSTNL